MQVWIILGLLAFIVVAFAFLLRYDDTPPPRTLWFKLSDIEYDQKFDINETSEMNTWWKEHPEAEWNFYVCGEQMFDEWQPIDNFFLFIDSNIFKDQCSLYHNHL